MKETKKIFLRYAIAAAITIISLIIPIFYFVFRPLTVLPAIAVLKAFYNVSWTFTAAVVNSHAIEFIDACIAGSAYLLLFLLNVLTPNICFKKRAFVFLFSAALLLAMNIFRLVILIFLLVEQSAAFNLTHKVFWYGISTIYVVLIWLLTVLIFKIKTVPFVSDVRFLLKARIS